MPFTGGGWNGSCCPCSAFPSMFQPQSPVCVFVPVSQCVCVFHSQCVFCSFRSHKSGVFMLHHSHPHPHLHLHRIFTVITPVLKRIARSMAAREQPPSQGSYFQQGCAVCAVLLLKLNSRLHNLRQRTSQQHALLIEEGSAWVTVRAEPMEGCIRSSVRLHKVRQQTMLRFFSWQANLCRSRLSAYRC